MLRLPASLPCLFNGFRAAAPGCILGAMVAEWLAASTGLGLYIFDAAARWHDSAQLVDAA
jgi:ABC-type nitrate/sulfonate/bicarbonate transport system permease component